MKLVTTAKKRIRWTRSFNSVTRWRDGRKNHRVRRPRRLYRADDAHGDEAAVDLIEGISTVALRAADHAGAQLVKTTRRRGDAATLAGPSPAAALQAVRSIFDECWRPCETPDANRWISVPTASAAAARVRHGGVEQLFARCPV